MKLALLLLGIITLSYSIPILTPYRSLDVAGADKDPVVSSLLQFGAKELIKQGLEEKKLSHGDFHLTKINSIHMQTMNGLNYRFDVTLQDQSGVTVNSAFTLNYQPRTHEKTLSSLTYSVGSAHPFISQLEVGHKSLAADDFLELDVGSVTGIPEVQSALQYGVSEIINKGMAERNLGVAQYTISNIVKIEKQTTGSGVNYRFNVGLTDGANTRVQAAFIVYIRGFDQVKSLTSYNYQVQTTVTTTTIVEADPTAYVLMTASAARSSEQVQTCLNFGTAEITRQAKAEGKIDYEDFVLTNLTSVESQTVRTYTFYRFNIEMKNDKGSTLTALFTIVYNTATQRPGIKSFLYKVVGTKITATVDAEGYTTVELLDVQLNSEIKTCLEYGVEQIIQKGLTEKKLTVAKYTLTNINSVGRYSDGTYNYYKFDCDLSNGASVSVRATFVVRYNTRTAAKAFPSSGYKYTVTTTTTTKSSVEADETAYEDVDVTGATSDAQISGSLDFCASEILEIAKTQGKLTKTTGFKVTKLTKIQKQTVGNYLFTKIEMNLGDGNSTAVNINAVVVLDTTTGQRTLKGYTLSVKIITLKSTSVKQPADADFVEVSPSELAISLDAQSAIEYAKQLILQGALRDNLITDASVFSVDKVTASSVSTGGSIFYKFTLVLSNGDDKELDATAIILHEQSGRDTNRGFNYILKITESKQLVIEFPEAGAYVDVDDSEVPSNSDIQAALQYGQNEVLQDAIKDNKIKSVEEYSLKKITRVARAIVGKHTFYRFVITMDNDEDTSIEATFDIFYNDIVSRFFVKNMDYLVTLVQNMATRIQEPADAEFEGVSREEYENSGTIQGILGVGIQQLIQIAYNEEKIKDTNFHVVATEWVAKASVKVFTFYRFNVTLSNDDDTTVYAILTVVQNAKNGENTLKSYSYNVRLIIWTAANYAVPDSKSFDSFDVEEVQSDENIKEVFTYANSEILAEALKEEKIQSTNYDLQEIAGARRITVRHFTFYQFTYTLVSSEDDDNTISISCTVAHDNNNKENALREFSFNIVIIQTLINSVTEPADEVYNDLDVSAIRTDESVGTSFNTGLRQLLDVALREGKITTTDFEVSAYLFVKTVTIKKYVFYRFSVTLSNDVDTTISAIFTVVHSSKSGEDSLRRYNYEVTITQTLINEVSEPDDKDYREVATHELDTDDKLSTLFEFGVHELQLKAVEEGKISVANFVLKDLNSIKTAIVRNYAFYRFDFSLTDRDESTMDCTMTLVYSSKNGESSLRRYHYQVTVVRVFVSNATEPADDRYTDIEEAEITGNDIVKGGWQYASREIVRIALEEEKITTSEDLRVQTVVRARRATVGRFTFFKFVLVIFNDDDTTINVTITVVYDPRSGEYDYRSYEYDVLIVTNIINDVAEPADDLYSEFAVSELDEETLAKETFEFGWNELLTKGVAEGKITHTNFSLQRTTIIARRVTVKSYVFYWYSFTLDDGEGTTLDCNIRVIHSSKRGDNSLRRYSYTVTFIQTQITSVAEPDDSEYVDIPEKDMDLEKTQTAYHFGCDGVISKSIEEGKIVAGTAFLQRTVTSAKWAIVKKYVFYRFELKLKDDKGGADITAIITVIQDAKTGELCLRKYWYEISITTTQTTIETEVDETITKTTTVIRYTQISITELTEAQYGCIRSAVREIIRRLFKDGILKDVNFHLTTVDAAYYKVEGGITYWKFTVHVENTEGLTLELSFTTCCDCGGEGATVYSFSVLGSTKEIGKVVCVDSDDMKSAIASLVGNYETVDTTEVNGCSEIHEAMSYGAQLVGVEIAKEEGLKDADFEVTKINSVYRQFFGGVNYRFNVDLENSIGETARATFTVNADRTLATLYYVFYE